MRPASTDLKCLGLNQLVINYWFEVISLRSFMGTMWALFHTAESQRARTNKELTNIHKNKPISGREWRGQSVTTANCGPLNRLVKIQDYQKEELGGNDSVWPKLTSFLPQIFRALSGWWCRHVLSIEKMPHRYLSIGKKVFWEIFLSHLIFQQRADADRRDFI